jgi:hypothetical protein
LGSRKKINIEKIKCEDIWNDEKSKQIQDFINNHRELEKQKIIQDMVD